MIALNVPFPGEGAILWSILISAGDVQPHRHRQTSVPHEVFQHLAPADTGPGLAPVSGGRGVRGR